MKGDYISAAMVSRVTGISYATVAKHIKSGVLPAHRNGDSGKYRIDTSDMERYAYDAWEAGYYMYNPYELLYDRMRLYGVLETL